MTSIQPKVSVDLHSSNNNIVSATMTRDDILTLAQNEYARQLCKYTKAQLDNTKLYKSKQPSSSLLNNISRFPIESSINPILLY
ncbi:hypothetical protein RO3G_00876 [Rhizopus delemar RA 99-880]|uniref:Uncharacterized protein n=1 Tax=Rhizopus delemar (strain RA 99-880 / ATCC MYA-4621 / FGSC 9543 / NRRL 43880) TaxID=246409 RepID=I1BIZ2_RHIO9|nr:hypothetical protein RO3G_00876 [Rhizopus delemar RA 99-880]|eukprot:EIE76172.1 hypothetical protein RO3G_00876 [Rhizopus delemar RA 99-880]